MGGLGLIPGLERAPGEGNGYPLQYSGLENSMDCVVLGVAKSQTRLSDFHFHFPWWLSGKDHPSFCKILKFSPHLILIEWSKWMMNNLKSLITRGFFFFFKNSGKCEVAPSCPTLCNPVDCSLPGSSVHGILQARVLEWVAISFSRGSSWPRDQTEVSNPGLPHWRQTP